MTNTQAKAIVEMGILAETTPDAAILPFRTEIFALCEAFGKSGQSGGSAPFVATAISKAVQKLLLQDPISPITGGEAEWVEVGDGLFQNNRCSAVFKDAANRPYYLNAIVWKGVEEWDTFTGRVYLDKETTTMVRSKQYIQLPFKPKTFYIDVIRVPITKKEGENKKLHFIQGDNNECYYSYIKNPEQLKAVWKYYIRP